MNGHDGRSATLMAEEKYQWQPGYLIVRTEVDVASCAKDAAALLVASK
jgi:hypothetical protein